MARSTSKLDVGQVVAFSTKLYAAAALVDQVAEDWQQEHGAKWASEMRTTVAVDSGELWDSIRQVEPGGITFGDAYWWRFLEYGTVKMAPRPFINPTMKRIRTPARKDAAEWALNLLRGRK